MAASSSSASSSSASSSSASSSSASSSSVSTSYTLYDFLSEYTWRYWDYELLAKADEDNNDVDRINQNILALVDVMPGQTSAEFLRAQLSNSRFGEVSIKDSSNFLLLQKYAISPQYVLTLTILSKSQHSLIIAGESEDNIYLVQSLPGVYGVHFVSLSWEQLLQAFYRAFLGDFMPLLHANNPMAFVGHFNADNQQIYDYLDQLNNPNIYPTFAGNESAPKLTFDFTIYQRVSNIQKLPNLSAYNESLDIRHENYLQTVSNRAPEGWIVDPRIPREYNSVASMVVYRQRQELGMDETENALVNGVTVMREIPVVNRQSQTVVKWDDPANLRDGQVYVYTDGSGQGRGASGWAYVFTRDGQILPNGQGSGQLPAPSTSNIAELSAIYYALIVANNANFRDFTLFSDSNYSIKAVSVWWKGWEQKGWCTSKGEPVQNQELIRSIIPLVQAAGVKLRHIKAHSGYKYNEVVDQLAKQARLS